LKLKQPSVEFAVCVSKLFYLIVAFRVDNNDFTLVSVVTVEQQKTAIYEIAQ
jgi:hypothetical protein